MDIPFSSFTSNLHTDDLKHLTAVRAVQHNKFAEENGLASFLMSAKNGDQVNQAFWKVASTLAGTTCCVLCCGSGVSWLYVVETVRCRIANKRPIHYLLFCIDDHLCITAAGVPYQKFEQQSQSIVVPATIIDHKRYETSLSKHRQYTLGCAGQLPAATLPLFLCVAYFFVYYFCHIGMTRM